ncbi:MAG: arginine--tRNA ligase [Bacilli bacterium]|nr:arginine--tRNA ligase [Bacilli bacterium]
MKDFIKQQEEQLKSIITECGYEVNEVSLVVSSRKDLGQYQYNGAMSLAKAYHKNPNEIANEIINKMQEYKDYTNLNVAGPGFINISFTDEIITNYFNALQENKKVDIDIPSKKIVIDYGGPNVAKTLHVGHLRSANIGEAIKRLAKYMNYDVISDVHLGDWGRPLGLVILELKNIHPEWVYFDESFKGEYPDTCPITNEYLEKLYPIASNKAKEDEEYLNEARIITTKLQQKEKGYYDLWKQIVKISTDEIKRLYDILNISFDLWEGESDADQYVPEVIEYLKSKGLVQESNGALIMDVSNLEDNSPMPPLLLVKSNGSVSYETTDLATIWERMKKFNPEEIWYVVDNRQALHFEQVFRAAYKSGIVPNNVKLEFFGFGTMNGKDGKPFKTRDGGVMTLNTLINLVKEETLKNLNESIKGEEREEISTIIGTGTLKYADLLPYRATDYIFDIEKFSDLNGKTGVYLLYSTLRMKSLLEKAKANNIKIDKISIINNDSDRSIYLKLLEETSVLYKSLNNKSLNEIAEYLYQLTNTYNSFYSSTRVITEENTDLRESWLVLTEIVYETNKTLLEILGIYLPNKI